MFYSSLFFTAKFMIFYWHKFKFNPMQIFFYRRHMRLILKFPFLHLFFLIYANLVQWFLILLSDRLSIDCRRILPMRKLTCHTRQTIHPSMPSHVRRHRCCYYYGERTSLHLKCNLNSFHSLFLPLFYDYQLSSSFANVVTSQVSVARESELEIGKKTS